MFGVRELLAGLPCQKQLQRRQQSKTRGQTSAPEEALQKAMGEEGGEVHKIRSSRDGQQRLRKQHEFEPHKGSCNWGLMLWGRYTLQEDALL